MRPIEKRIAELESRVRAGGYTDEPLSKEMSLAILLAAGYGHEAIGGDDGESRRFREMVVGLRSELGVSA